MKKKYRNDAFAAIHETASDLHDAGAMDIRTLRKFDKMCLTSLSPRLYVLDKIRRGQEAVEQGKTITSKVIQSGLMQVF